MFTRNQGRLRARARGLRREHHDRRLLPAPAHWEPCRKGLPCRCTGLLPGHFAAGSPTSPDSSSL